MKKSFWHTNNSQFASTTCGASFACVNNIADTMIMVSVILSRVCLRALAIIMAALAAEEKVNVPKARACA